MERKNRHAIYDLEYHLVVCTKYRKKILKNEVKDRLIEITYTLFEGYGFFINEISTDEGHIHILFEAPPGICLSQKINNYKTVTSSLLRKEFAEILNQIFYKPLFWSDSYYICTVSERTEATVKSYIQNQGKEKDG